MYYVVLVKRYIWILIRSEAMTAVISFDKFTIGLVNRLSMRLVFSFKGNNCMDVSMK